MTNTQSILDRTFMYFVLVFKRPFMLCMYSKIAAHEPLKLTLNNAFVFNHAVTCNTHVPLHRIKGNNDQ